MQGSEICRGRLRASHWRGAVEEEGCNDSLYGPSLNDSAGRVVLVTRECAELPQRKHARLLPPPRLVVRGGWEEEEEDGCR